MTFTRQRPAPVVALRTLVATGERDDQILVRPRLVASLARAPLLRALVVCILRRLREGAL